jgi:hypothetical protein
MSEAGLGEYVYLFGDASKVAVWVEEVYALSVKLFLLRDAQMETRKLRSFFRVALGVSTPHRWIRAVTGRKGREGRSERLVLYLAKSADRTHSCVSMATLSSVLLTAACGSPTMKLRFHGNTQLCIIDSCVWVSNNETAFSRQHSALFLGFISG